MRTKQPAMTALLALPQESKGLLAAPLAFPGITKTVMDRARAVSALLDPTPRHLAPNLALVASLVKSLPLPELVSASLALQARIVALMEMNVSLVKLASTVAQVPPHAPRALPGNSKTKRNKARANLVHLDLSQPQQGPKYASSARKGRMHLTKAQAPVTPARAASMLLVQAISSVKHVLLVPTKQGMELAAAKIVLLESTPTALDLLFVIFAQLDVTQGEAPLSVPPVKPVAMPQVVKQLPV
jgi:hypothetical protein